MIGVVARGWCGRGLVAEAVEVAEESFRLSYDFPPSRCLATVNSAALRGNIFPVLPKMGLFVHL